MDKPLVKTIRVGHVRHSVIYEGIGLLCFHCGQVGHKLESCPEPISQLSTNCETSKQPEEKEGSNEEVNSFGPWMLVTCRKRQGKIAPALFGLNKMEGSDSPVVNDASYVQKKGQGEGYSKDAGKSGSGSTKGRAKVKGSNKGKAKVGNEPYDSGNAHPIGLAYGSSSLANANPNSAQNSFQSQALIIPITQNHILKPNSNPDTHSYSPQQSMISLRPQKPHSQTPHVQHSTPSSSNGSRSHELEDHSKRQTHSIMRGHHRTNSSGSPPYLGMVSDRDGTSLGEHSTKCEHKRLSRSPSPQRRGLAPRDKSVLEFLIRHPEDCWSPQLVENALSIVAGALLSLISGRSPSGDTTGVVQRAKGPSLSSHITQLDVK